MVNDTFIKLDGLTRVGAVAGGTMKSINTYCKYPHMQQNIFYVAIYICVTNVTHKTLVNTG